LIRIENLSKIFKTSEEVHALRGVSTHVEAGDIFGVIGMSGAGKSTLLRCIAQLEKPTGGAIYIDGRNITELSGKENIELRKKVGVIFQGYHLLMQRTVRDNIGFPLELSGWKKADINKKVDELLALVGLENKADAYPSQLSGGQMQRVAIARGLANNPSILLCDEPTGALDYTTGKSVLSLLHEMSRTYGMTVVIITHNTALTSMADRVIHINSGTVTGVELNQCPKDISEIEW